MDTTTLVDCANCGVSFEDCDSEYCESCLITVWEDYCEECGAEDDEPCAEGCVNEHKRNEQ